MGVGLLVLGVLHIWLPALLSWGTDLTSLTRVSRATVQMHAGFVGLLVAALGLVALLAPRELLGGSPLGVATCAFGLVVFGARLVLEFTTVAPATRGTRWWRFHLVAIPGWIAVTIMWATALAWSTGLLRWS